MNQNEEKQKVFTAADFENFNIVKLHAWISVYVDREVQKQLNMPLFPPKNPTEEELQRYREFLADNFNYEKYNSPGPKKNNE